MTAPAPLLGHCPECGHDWPLAPGGVLVRHQRDQHPVYAKNCEGSRKAPKPEKENTQ